MMYLVTTTINVPTFLEDICKKNDNFKAIVIGDLKTPKEAWPFCESLGVRYLDIDDQKKAIPKELWDMMPLNTGSRKMIGTYLAYLEPDCEGVIMMDDDNFPVEERFITAHSIVGKVAKHSIIQSESGWFNTAESMSEKNNIPFYPRGYPWSQRFNEAMTHETVGMVKAVVNQGIVLGDPDIDAVSRLFYPIEVTGIYPHYYPNFSLSPGTWSSFNDQNTALSRELIPVYFKPPSGSRNADIWVGYVIQRLTEHMGDVVAFGQPLVRQVRNGHDLWEDYELEKLNNIATDDFVALLRGVELTANSYIDALGELVEWCLPHTPDLLETYDTYRHSQYPTLEKQRERNEAAMDLIWDFFIDYKAWYDFMKGVPDASNKF